jgi:hypothetical protein
MASAEEKWKGESRDRQVIVSNAKGAEEKTEEANPSGKDQKDPSGKEGGGGGVPLFAFLSLYLNLMLNTLNSLKL